MLRKCREEFYSKMGLNRKQKLLIGPIIVFVIILGVGLSYYSNRPRNINVLLITIDTLRPDHLSCYGYKRNTSPNIDKLAKEGILFTQAIAQGSHTAASVTSLITSTYPNIHNVKDWGYQLNPDMHLYTLPEILRLHGYKTALISDQISLSLIKGLEKDFDTYNTILTNASTFGPASKRVKIVEITDWAIDWLKNNKHNKFFLWLYYLGPHGPYTPPPPYNRIFLNDEYYNIKQSIPISDNAYLQSTIGKIPKYLAIDDITEVDYYISQYDGAIRYVDSQIGRLCEELKKSHLDKNTIIILTADHGEGMGEHNLYFCHAIFLYDELIKIPLIIKFNKALSGDKRINVQVRAIDIMPTVLDILGIKKYKSMEGASLIPLIFNRKINFPAFAYSEFINRKSVRMEDWKLIYDENNKLYELYNLKDDPQELNNIVSVERGKFEYLRKKLDVYSKQGTYPDKIIEPILGEETKKRLRSLGYAQ